MKKYFLLIVFLLSLLPSFAQEPVDFEKYKSIPFISEIEIFGGPSLSSLRGNSGVDNTSQNSREIKIGYSFGIGICHKFSKDLSISILGIFERKGGKSNTVTNYFDEGSQTFKEGNAYYDYSYMYFTFPLLFEYSFGNNKQFGLATGPYLSYLHKQTLSTEVSFAAGAGIFDQTKDNTDFDSGISTKFNWSIPSSERVALKVSLINNLGLKNIRPEITDGEFMKTNNTTLLIALLLKN